MQVVVKTRQAITKNEVGMATHQNVQIKKILKPYDEYPKELIPDRKKPGYKKEPSAYVEGVKNLISQVHGQLNTNATKNIESI